MLPHMEQLQHSKWMTFSELCQYLVLEFVVAPSNTAGNEEADRFRWLFQEHLQGNYAFENTQPNPGVEQISSRCRTVYHGKSFMLNRARIHLGPTILD